MTEKSPTSIQSKVCLVFTQQSAPLYSHLSLNIIREICLYIGELHLLPCIKSTTLSLYNLEAHVYSTHTLRFSLKSYVLCRVTDAQYCGVLQRDAFMIDFCIMKRFNLPDLPVARKYPGIVFYNDTVFLFGGDHPKYNSCAQLSLTTAQWCNAPNMTYGRSMFTPCVFHHEIYLCAGNDTNEQFEVFNPANESFRLLPSPEAAVNTWQVAIADEDAIVLIANRRAVVRWNPETGKKRVKSIGGKMYSCDELDGYLDNGWNPDKAAYCIIPPMKYRNRVFWVDWSSGGLMQLDLTTLMYGVDRSFASETMKIARHSH